MRCHSVDLYLDILQTVPLFGDNLAAHFIARNNINSTRTKHYDLKYRYLTEMICKNLIKTHHVETSKNLADFLSKFLSVTLDFLTWRDFFVATTVEQLKVYVPPVSKISFPDRRAEGLIPQPE